MAYIGSTPTSQNFTSGTDYFSGTGSQTAYTLTRTVNSVNDIEVVINNVVQQPSTAYTLSGTTITFTSAPSSGTNNIYVRYLATNMQSFTVPANSITRTQLDSNLQAGFQGRNKIINGHMVVDQRNAGASVTPTSNGAYTLDRWQMGLSNASKYSVQQSSTAPTGFSNSLLVTSLAATTVSSGDYYSLLQAVEGFNTSDLGYGTANSKTVTLSFWVRSSLTGTFGGFLQNSANNRSYPYSYTISSANTWEQKTITIAGDTSGTWVGATNGVGLYVGFSLGMGTDRKGTANTWQTGNYRSVTGETSLVGTSGATFYITGVQLEEGTTATSFERESYSVTLQKCQRYCYVVSTAGGYSAYGTTGQFVSTTRVDFPILFPTYMRSSPTGTYSAANTFLPSSAGADFTPSAVATGGGSANSQAISVSFTVSGATAGRAATLTDLNTTTSKMTFSAEL